MQKITRQFFENWKGISGVFEETDQEKGKKKQGGQKHVWSKEENWLDSFHFLSENHSREAFLSKVTLDSLCCWQQEKICRICTFEAPV